MIVPRAQVARPGTHMQTTTLSYENIHLHGELFANVFRARKQSFIIQQNWDLPEALGMEYDQYDTPASRWIAPSPAPRNLAPSQKKPNQRASTWAAAMKTQHFG